jgi:protein-S-isoprenylcysteine O-methyltransferase Ste14
VRLLLLAVLLFAPAGTLRWPEAWGVMGMWTVWAILITSWLARHDPALLEERLNPRPIQKGQKRWDKVFVLAAFPLGIALIVLPGLDAVRFHWTEVPPLAKGIGFAALIPAALLFFLVLRENTYLSRVVKIDRERGHKVITTGPYASVRHPMYVSAILFYFGWSLALGSLLTLLAGALLSALMVVRTYLEDRTLHEELPGYREYAQRTRYRLVPGVW